MVEVSHKDQLQKLLILRLGALQISRRNSQLPRWEFKEVEGLVVLTHLNPEFVRFIPFFSWTQNENNRVSVHASYQFTGDCPGFSLTKTLDENIPILRNYSEIIYNYSMSVNTTLRESFARIDITE